MVNNNYFRVQGSLDTFGFDEGDEESVKEALAAARAVAKRQRTSRGTPAVLVWRRTSSPAARSIPAVGEAVVAAN